MYETQTFEAILQRMLDRVPGSIDKREGSIIYDALAPAAAELAQIYADLDINLNLVFGNTSTGEYLARRTADFGIERQQASKAERLGLFYNSENVLMDVPIGSRYSLDGLYYKAIEKISTGNYKLQSETAGSTGNANYGQMLPMDYINGLGRAILSEVLIPGEDDETDDSLRKRFLAKVQKPGTSGNVSDYKNWALSVSGVGAAYVKPLWDGPGTVKVTILDSEMRPASTALTEEVQNFISPLPGMGQEVAPIGAIVTVSPAEGVAVNLTAKLLLNGSASLADVQRNIEAAVAAYLKGLAFADDPSPKYVRIGALLLDIEGVNDYSFLQINGGTSNIPISPDQVAILGTVDLEV
ncbi:putative phage protein gp47/JayE [Paenibacillus sp. BK033]|uniref:baseplate J/gp47 family protein n=1 Tax=Paenibacillus sp. BK033 TaxID=2512133 RepID=UPI001047BD9F|nr:baseplate J/gp47 family protein [Paenibacillus sp. BK033]TCM93130.1 putative phage protein gp47/JayE [Paenibacillus sp. BK033]